MLPGVVVGMEKLLLHPQLGPGVGDALGMALALSHPSAILGPVIVQMGKLRQEGA